MLAYVKQQAWLHTVPDKKNTANLEDYSSSLTHQDIMESKYGDTEWWQEIIDGPTLPIEQQLWYASFNGVHDEQIRLPYSLAHIWVHLLDIGPVSSNGMGINAISYDEINNWMLVSGVKMSFWETTLLHKCSQAWVSTQYEAKKNEFEPYWVINSTQAVIDRRKRVSEGLKMLGLK